jgi:hypothetical protein
MGNSSNPSKEFVPCDYSFETANDICYMKVSPDKTMIAIGYGRENIRLFNLETMSMIGDFEGCAYSRIAHNTATFDWSPCSRYLAYRWDYVVRIMDVTTMTKVKEFTQ